MPLAGMSLPLVILPVVMLLGGVEVVLRDVLPGRVVGAPEVGVLGGRTRGCAQQHAGFKHVQFGEAHRAGRGAHRRRRTLRAVIRIAARLVRAVGPPARLETREDGTDRHGALRCGKNAELSDSVRGLAGAGEPRARERAVFPCAAAFLTSSCCCPHAGGMRV